MAIKKAGITRLFYLQPIENLVGNFARALAMTVSQQVSYPLFIKCTKEYSFTAVQTPL